MAYLQWKTYYLDKSDDGHGVLDLIKNVNSKLEQFDTEYLLNDVNTYNSEIEIMCYSQRSTEAIEHFTEQFDEEYGLTRDAKSFATLINYQLDRGDYREALDLFDRSLEEIVAWDNEYGGIYITTLFRLLATYCFFGR
ncbi:unnamed protein product [Ambrosiozyma monospora]|uniref:Unnamed protein product n=1 Tax=Ambrosiozyma monospora TaxID=43982 RepID=A0ACB5UDJ0_AMBMO|nr:unnamed protein product [Ambrosiozyma monospora]